MSATTTLDLTAVTLSDLLAGYHAAKGAEKAPFRAEAERRQNVATEALDIEAAKEAMEVRAAMVATTATEKAPVDHNVIVAARVAALRAAADAILAGTYIPDGINADGIDLEKVAELVADATPDADAVAAIATEKITRRSRGRNGVIVEAIERAFESVESGVTMTVSEIVAAGTDGDYKPSGGAVANALRDGKCDSFVTVTDSPLAATKL